MQIISIIVGEPIIQERLAYVLDFLGNHPLCPEGVRLESVEESKKKGIVVYYGEKRVDENFFVKFENNFFSKSQKGKDWSAEGKSHFADNADLLNFQSLVNLNSESFQFDIFETIFFHISRYEEVFAKKNQLDAHKRMRTEEMFLVKNGLEKTPIVDLLVFNFFKKLGFKPKSRPTEYHMSHDIDILLKFPSGKKVVKAFGGIILRQRSFSGLMKLTRQYFRFFTKKEKDPFDTYDWLFMDKKFKTKTVYILPEGTLPRIEKHFRLDDPKVAAMIDLAKKRGYEIGLHPSYNAGFDESLFQKEKEKLEKVVGEKLIRTRQHFLRWDWSKTPRIIEKAALKTDSTLGFSDRIGFRCGTGFSYRLYDFENERAFDFYEQPLVVMDVSLLRESENPKAYLSDFLEKNQTNTAITFNFHNSIFDGVYEDVEELKSIYFELGMRNQ